MIKLNAITHAFKKEVVQPANLELEQKELFNWALISYIDSQYIMMSTVIYV